MNTGIFGKLSAEARGVAVEGKTNFTVEDAIDNDGVYDEIVAIGAEAHADAVIMNQYALGAESMERQIDAAEAMLQNPASIVSGTVTLARESFEATAMMLGATSSDISTRLTLESIESNPSASLEIGNEGVKDFLKKTWGVIKLIFKRIINGIKKLVVKVVVALNGTEKKAKALKTSMKKDGADKASKTKHESDVGKKINSKLGASDAIRAAGGLDIEPQLKMVMTTLEVYRNAAMSMNSDDANPMKLTIRPSETLNAWKMIQKSMHTLAGSHTDLVSKFDIDAIDIKTTVGAVVPIYAKGKNLIYVEFDADKPEKETGEYVLDSLSKVKMVVRHASLKDEPDDDSHMVMSRSDLDTRLDALIVSGRGVKKFADTRLKEIETLDKEGAKAADNATGNKYINRMKSNMMNHARAFVVGVSLDSIMAYVTEARSELWYLKVTAALYSKSEI